MRSVWIAFFFVGAIGVLPYASGCRRAPEPSPPSPSPPPPSHQTAAPAVAPSAEEAANANFKKAMSLLESSESFCLKLKVDTASYYGQPVVIFANVKPSDYYNYKFSGKRASFYSLEFECGALRGHAYAPRAKFKQQFDTDLQIASAVGDSSGSSMAELTLLTDAKHGSPDIFTVVGWRSLAAVIHSPEKFDSSSIKDVLSRAEVHDSIVQCFRKHRTKEPVVVSTTILPTGVVYAAQATDKFAHSSIGRCVQTVVGSLTFAPFHDSIQSVSLHFDNYDGL